MATPEKKTNHPSRYGSDWNHPLDRFFNSRFPDFWNRSSDTVPSVNIREEKNNYHVELAAPGLKKEDINIDVEGNMLTISCEKESENTDDNDGYSHREYNYSSFSRTLSLPENADSQKIAARYKDGILNLDIPKVGDSHKNKSQKIKIE